MTKIGVTNIGLSAAMPKPTRRGQVRARGVAGAWLIGAALFCQPASAQQCEDPQAACGARVQSECLSQLGAGVLKAEGDAPAPQAQECEAQFSGYRQCLIDIARNCPSSSAPTPSSAGAEPEIFEILASLGGVIAEPKTVVEFYNNALVYERRGDTLSARKMYEQAIAREAGKIDIHLRYVAVLKAQEGLLGAREIYADLARAQPGNLALGYAAATLAPGTVREDRLRALLEQEPRFAPAWYAISRFYSLDRLGQQSREDKKLEKAALEAFLQADEAGRVYGWFLEKALVEDWREDAARRYAPYKSVSLDTPDVTLSASASNDGWILTLSIAEAAQAIRYSVDGGPVRDIGHGDYIDQRTGKPMPLSFFNLPLGTQEAAIDVWYDDVRGAEQGPFRLNFDAAAAFVANSKKILEQYTQGWLAGNEWDNGYLVYFSHLVSHRCGIAQIRYGINQSEPDTEFPIDPCDPKNPHNVGDQIYITLPQKPGLISVQLTYHDGTLSPIREFRF